MFSVSSIDPTVAALPTIHNAQQYDITQLEPYYPEAPRVPRRFREVNYIQGPPGQVKTIRRRLPTPKRDVVERVVVQQAAAANYNGSYETPSYTTGYAY